MTLDLATLDAVLGPRTKLVAVGYASNAVGTINPVAEIVRRAHAVGAWTYVDAVHAAPHLPIDVRALGTDFLACSTYKFFGPHAGVLYGRAEILDALPAYKLVPATDRFETGTGNFEGLAGVTAAVEYLADVGVAYGGAGGRTRRAASGVLAGMARDPGVRDGPVSPARRRARGDLRAERCTGSRTGRGSTIGRRPPRSASRGSRRGTSPRRSATRGSRSGTATSTRPG